MDWYSIVNVMLLSGTIAAILYLISNAFNALRCKFDDLRWTIECSLERELDLHKEQADRWKNQVNYMAEKLYTYKLLQTAYQNEFDQMSVEWDDYPHIRVKMDIPPIASRTVTMSPANSLRTPSR